MKALRIVAVIGLVAALSACATTVGIPADTPPAAVGGFWWGLWNGFTAPWSMIGHVFDPTIAVYDKLNNGGWYDFGFLIGVGAFAGGASSSR